jgi:aminodeoxyfutalosine deaminase
MTRKFSASWVFPLHTPPLKNGIVEVDDQGVIIGLTDTGGKLTEMERLEYHSGIIAPGFVNAHCHLELSHLHGAIPSGKGLSAFLGGISHLRTAPEEVILQAAIRADRDMYLRGISATGDISNSTVTVAVKQNSRIRYVTFAETFGFHPSRAEKAFSQAMSVWNSFHESGLASSVVPHAPYSVSGELFSRISCLGPKESSIISMHNQESEAENRFFHSGDGTLMNHFSGNLGLDTSSWKPTGKNSLESVLHHLSADKPLLLIHNTYMTRRDIAHLKKVRKGSDTFLVLCPGSNLYIENRLPPVGLFREEHMNICLGTDSLASNNTLSILDEMKILLDHFTGTDLNELLTWACTNGSKALKLDSDFGTLEPGKNPGLILLTGVDLNNLRLTPASRVKRLV